MGSDSVAIMIRIIHELLEYLALKGIPVAVQQRPLQCIRLLLQLEDVVLCDERILCGQRRDVLRSDRLVLVERLRPDLLLANLHIRPSVNKLLFHPAMPDVPRVARRADNGHDAKALFRTESRLQEIIDRLRKGCQLIEIHELRFKAAVVKSVGFVLAMTE